MSGKVLASLQDLAPRYSFKTQRHTRKIKRQNGSMASRSLTRMAENISPNTRLALLVNLPTTSRIRLLHSNPDSELTTHSALAGCGSPAAALPPPRAGEGSSVFSCLCQSHTCSYVLLLMSFPCIYLSCPIRRKAELYLLR